jgi:hypothetical protein
MPAAESVAAPASNSTWAGHLETPGTASTDAATRHALTSASYTTGFDNSDAAPLPSNALKTVAVDPAACPDDLNCTFRAKAGAAVPLARPRIALAAPIHARVDAPPTRDEKKPTGFAALMPKLPSTHTLLKPFTFVANTFSGLMQKL